MSDDPYSRLQYRRLIAWPARIEREAPFLEEILGSGPSRRVLDLGCGTGEHSRFLATQGFHVVGVDRSAKMLEEASREPVPDNLRFVESDLAELGDAGLEEGTVPVGGARGGYGGAVCLGNTLPHLDAAADLRRFFGALRRLLRPGAPFLLQILNYERIFALDERHLPLNFRPDPEAGRESGGQVVFLRLMELHDDGTVIFCPTSLRFRPQDDEPVKVVSSRKVKLHGWRRDELEDLLGEAGFEHREVFGGFRRETYDPLRSRDVVLVAR